MKTVILCGGLGTRLSEETIIKPKPMVEIGGYPILWHIMKRYLMYDIKDFYIALGYKGDYIKNYFINYRNKMSDFNIDFSNSSVNYINNFTEDWKVNLIDTGKDTMTGGRLLRLKQHLEKEEMFMLTYGDGVSNIDINKLINFHKSHGKIATMSIVRPPVRFGEVFSESGIVTSFKEKPQAQSGWINGGFFVFSNKIFDYIEGDSIMLERKPLEELVLNKELMSYSHEGFWQCMDTVRDRDLLIDMWENNNALWLK
tara:strand:- start:6759 stop:7526 length:768 start_codon:yes stop_codon:yes gene_type:complete